MPKLLIVDDEPYIRILLEQTLEDFEDKGIEIYTADNGSSALEMISKEKPDIVYLDVMMPIMNGYDVCRAIKSNKDLKHIYVIMLTARAQEYDIARCKEAGADMCITKPFDPDFIIEKTGELLNINLDL